MLKEEKFKSEIKIKDKKKEWEKGSRKHKRLPCVGGGLDPHLGLYGAICPCDGCVGLAPPFPGKDLASRLPTSQTRHQRACDRQCGAHMGGSQGFSVKTCFLAFFCPIRPGSPAPSWDHREAAGTYIHELWIHTAHIQFLKVRPKSCQFPFFPPWGYSDLQQISSHCHSGMVLIIFLGLCKFNESPATFLYKLGVNPKYISKLIPCNQYLTFFASTSLQPTSSSAKHSKYISTLSPRTWWVFLYPCLMTECDLSHDLPGSGVTWHCL